MICFPCNIAAEPESKNSWMSNDVYLGNLRRVGKKRRRKGVYKPPPCPSSWFYLWLSVCYQPLLTTALNALAHWRGGIRSIAWPGKLLGIFCYLLCKHVTWNLKSGCKSTFGPGCLLVKHYKDLENQTGCSFSTIAKRAVETATQTRGPLRTTGIWPCTSWGARWSVSLQLSYPALAKEPFWKFWSSQWIFYYVDINMHKSLGGEK